MIEEWKEIEGYEGLYEVSNLGRVKSLKYGKERILKAGKDGCGYMLVNLCKEGKMKMFRIHRLVAAAFIPNPQNLPEINHIDENKENNCSDNLEWCDRKYNINHGTRNERISKRVLCEETGEIFPSTHEVERKLGFAQTHISDCCLGKYKTCGGFHWRYVS